MRRFSPVVLCIALLPAAAPADITLPKVIGDHMVLQRETDAAIWGWGKPGDHVHVRGSWMTDDRSTEVGADGRWVVRIPTPAAGGPFTVTISDGTTITLTDVMSGEVWLCGGQSNMEWPIRALEPGDAAKTIAGANNPDIRVFEVNRNVSLQPLADCEANTWGAVMPERAAEFSAVAYFFGQRLHEELGVPIGLIESDWGGTRVEAWMSPGALAPFDEYDAELQTIEMVTGDPGNRAALIEQRTGQWWDTLDPKAPDGWMNAEFDDSGWSEMGLPATLAADGLGAFDGIVYFRRTVELPEGWAGKPVTLSLGPIDDYDDVWVNGVHVGATHGENQWNVPRKYEVPGEAVRAGENTIAVRILDTAGPGGINGSDGQMFVQREDMLVPIAGEWEYARGAAAGDLPARPSAISAGPNTPTALYQGMITPLLPYTIRGAIWYQGEANVGNAARYGALFPAMIEDWRRSFECGPFSFYFVQIAPYHYGNSNGAPALLRDSQRKTLSLENTGMAVTMDIGNPRDIHPLNKRDVGDRLARWALAKDYGKTDIVFSGPLYKSCEAAGEGRMRVHFDHTDGGLAARGGALTHFLIAGDDHKFVPAQAEIDGDTVVVWSDDVASPTAVRYGWGEADEPNLFNGAGLPASSFRTDDWE